MLKKYGELSIYESNIPQSIFSILTKVYSIVINVVVEVVLGGQPIIGFNYSAKQYIRVKKTYKYILISPLAVEAISTIFCVFFPGTILCIFGSTDNELYMEFGRKEVRVYLMFILFNILIKMTAIFFQAVEESFKAGVAALVRDLIVFVPFA